MINAEFVEKALIGALLNDPSHRQHAPWLETSDFTHPLCRGLWHHISSGLAPDLTPPIDYVDLARALGVETGLHPRTTAPSQIAALQIQAPVNPDAAAYGRILVEVNIRDQMARVGLRIGTSGPPGTRAEMVTLGRLSQRWTAVTTTPKRTTTPPTPTLDDASQRARSASLPVLPSDVGADLDLAERVVIGSVIHDLPHGSRAALFTTLQAHDFSTRQTSATFRAARGLWRQGHHVDEITVTWQLQSAASGFGPGLPLQELRRDKFTSQPVEPFVDAILRFTARRSAEEARILIPRDAENLSLDLRSVGRRTSARLCQLAATEARAQRLVR